MKKLLVLLMVAAFACSPLVQSDAQAAPPAKHAAANHLKKANHRLKHRVQKLRQKLRQKLHQARQNKHHKGA